MQHTLNRREFLGTTALSVASGSLVFGFATEASAQGLPPEVNAWVVVQPDEKVITDLLTVLSGRERTVRLLDSIREEVGDVPSAWLPRLLEVA